MNGPRGYYVKQSKLVKERQMLYDITYLWNLKSKTNDQPKRKQTHTYREQTGGCQRRGVWGNGIKRYKLPVIK